MSKPKNIRSVLMELKAASHVYEPEGSRTSIKTFREELTRDEQMALIREIVETRRAELTRAYKSVVNLVLGHRRRTVKKRSQSKKFPRVVSGDSTRIVKQPCLVFKVKRKWKGEQDDNPKERLPRHLYAYWTINGTRRLCAVPTDVVDAGFDLRIEPQAGRQNITVDPKRPGVNYALGTVTCAIRRNNSPNPRRLYALSCRHVFSMSNKIDWSIWNTGIYLSDQSSLVAHTRAVCGELRSGAGSGARPNLDAQLAEVENPSNLEMTLQGLAIRGVARGVLDLPVGTYHIHSPRFKKPISATFLSEERPYSVFYSGIGVRAEFPLVYLLRPSSRTFGGDSGSPITDPNTGLLVGMLIGGNGDTVSVRSNLLVAMLPAWQLFNPKNYKRASKIEEWVLASQLDQG